MALTYRRGAIDALSSLVETRLAVLRSANGLDAAAELPEVAAQTRDYYQTALADGSHVTFLAFDGSRFVGAGGVSFFRVMPTVHIPTGQKAYIPIRITAGAALPCTSFPCWWKPRRRAA